jgi:hypothetical protein
LPEPDSPTTPTVSPARTAQVDAVDRADLVTGAPEQAGRGAEGDAHVARLQHHGRVRRDGRLAPRGLGVDEHPGIGVLGRGEDLRRDAAFTTSPRFIT